MANERRNLYRLLHVQPEAPPEIIKASFRALMSTLRGHPDLGGDPEHAARLNAAYDVLSSPEKRRAYDLSLRRPGRGAGPVAAGATAVRPGPATAAAVVSDPGRWLLDKRCPFCSLPFVGTPSRDQRCGRCESPIAPAPKSERESGEILGRRRGERISRELDAVVRLPHQPGEIAARLRDLSFTGLSFVCTPRVVKHTTLRIATASFDAVVLVIACRANGPLHTVHAHLLTLQMLRSGRGAFVSATA